MIQTSIFDILYPKFKIDKAIKLITLFSGYDSGTTCVAAKETGRKYIGMEIDKEYWQNSINRLNGINAFGQLSIFTDIAKIGDGNGNKII